MATHSKALSTALQHHQAGQLQAAEQIYRQILQADPKHPDAMHYLGLLAHQVGQHQAAIDLISGAIQIKKNEAAYHNNLAGAFLALRKLPEAVDSYRRAVILAPDFAEAHSNLGNVLKEQGKIDEAVACYRRASLLKPNFAEAHSNLGNVLRDQGKLDEAITSCRKALQLKPDLADAHSNLGNALKDQQKLDEAAASYRRAIALNPGFAEAHSNLCNALRDQGKVEEAIASCRRAIELKPDFVNAVCILLCTLQYNNGITLADLLEAHSEYDRRFGMPLRNALPQPPTPQNRDARLRLGIVSPDLWRHPVGFFLIRILENLRDEQVDVICYSDRLVKDDLTQQFESAATQWRDVHGWSDQRLAEQIRADRIDILFDMAGHTNQNRLLVFARKPAPVQITWLGYVGTTGLQAMDYILADRHLIPPEAEPFYCEKVLRMPDDYACYSEPGDAPAPGPLPALERGYVTFGSLNNLSKITPQVVEIWARILHRVPTSKLVIRYRGLDDPGTRKHFADSFAANGIASDRVNLIGWSPANTKMHLYNEIDIGLDPFPYSGATTTCDALWMGVPVVSCPLDTFASRQSLTHLNTVGLNEMVARNLQDYVEIAVTLANDLPRLASLRSTLRERMAASPLCNGKLFATNLMTLLRDMWKKHG